MTVTCADCGQTQTLPILPRRAIAECTRCDRVLDRRPLTRMDVSLAASIAAFLILPPAFFLPVMESTIQNLVFDRSRLVSSVGEIYEQVWFPFAFGFLFFAFIFPAIRSLLLILVLGSLRWGWRIPQLGRLFRWNEELRIWSMADVVALAGIVAYFRAAIPADVDILSGAWCYLAVAALMITADTFLNRRGVWYAIHPDPLIWRGAAASSCTVCELTVGSDDAARHVCPRCGAALGANMKLHFAPAAAAVAAAIPLFPPAYSFAVMVNDRITGVWEHTLLGTVQLLADYGQWEFGLLVLLMGIVLPVVVLGALLWLFARVPFPHHRGLVRRTRAYRTLKRLVRWPMIIPFIAAIAAPIVDFKNIDDIVAGPGATPYFALIVLMMVAVRMFEPRLMWMAAGEPADD
jgi:paraquat-inducible protein A